jgi:serine/threonine protein kinase/Tfp pilus assembly protein PilF
MSPNDDHIEKEEEDPSRTLDAGPPLLELGSHVGRYKLLRVLGEGGFGIVYLAEQQRPIKRRVALKIIKPGMDSAQVIRRFEAERQALALLDHPNVAHVYDAGTTEAGRPYFVMEYVKGVPVTEHCDRQKLTIEERLKLFVQVCEAIQHAHQKGIIHRDIKPSNIQVCIQGEQAIPKVIDFGVAKALSQPLTERTLVTEQGQLIGTPEYISPEQAEMTNQDIDTRSDIYSLGVLLYELLTGTLPFESQTLRRGSLEQMRAILREEEPKTPSTRVSSLDAEASTKLAKSCQSDAATLRRRLRGDLDWITLKAMEKDRMRRYQTAHALAEDIERHLNNEPVLAGPPGTLYRFRKLVRRNKATLAGALALVVILLLASAAAWLYVSPGRSPRLTSLAVKPLDDFSGDNSQAYLSDGMTEALCNALGNVSALSVRGRSSVMRYKGGQKSIQEMARELKVDAIVEGSILRAGDRIQITVRLIEAAADRILWSDKFERDLSNFFKVQEEVARAIAAEVRVRLTPEDQARLARAQTANRDAIETYLRGMQVWWQWSEGNNMVEALGYFEKAIAIDPRCAPAHAGKALAYIFASTWNNVGLWSPREGVLKGKEAAQQATTLDSTLEDGYVAMGFARMLLGWDWDGAEKDFNTALRLNPNSLLALDAYANFLALVRGRLDDAVGTLEKALKLDPLSPALHSDMGVFYLVFNEPNLAIPWLRETLNLDSRSFWARLNLGWCYLWTNEPNDALAEFQYLVQQAPLSPYPRQALGYAYGFTGQKDKARQVLADLEQLRLQKHYVPSSAWAYVYCGLGQYDTAIRYLEQACEERDPEMIFLKGVVEPAFIPLRDEPHFQALMKKVGLDQ